MSLTATIDLGAQSLIGGSSAPPLDVKIAAKPHNQIHRATERAIHQDIYRCR